MAGPAGMGSAYAAATQDTSALIWNPAGLAGLSTPEIAIGYLDLHGVLGYSFIGIAALANHHESWIRSVETWQVKKHNRDRQFSELARHLLAAYEVPLFMDRVWFNGNVVHQNWFKHIGTGQNIRTAPDIPIPLTKKMAHHFLKAQRPKHTQHLSLIHISEPTRPY